MGTEKSKPKRRRRKREGNPPTSTADPVTGYAESVVAGIRIAGPHVRNACQRHLNDLRDGGSRGLVWDIGAVRRSVGYYEDVLRVDTTAADGKATATGETRPFVLIDWQAFCVGSLFGWKRDDGTRRFRMAFIETGKGSGKSPLAAGIGLYMLGSDGEFRPEVYAAATKKDQAKVLFRDAVTMVEQSPDLSERFILSGGVEKTNIAYLPKGGFFRPISTEDRGRGQSGPRPHCGLLDEIHEHPTAAMVDMMRAGTKGRRQALILMITNSGYDQTTVCYAYHDYGVKVASGAIEDDAFFAYICALDKGDDPFEDRACWEKANPSLGVTITEKYLEELVVQAKGMPSKQNIVRRLNFCEWTEADSTWVTNSIWSKAEDESLDISDFLGEVCWLGLDLAYTTDLAALATVFERDDQLYGFLDFWKPIEGLREAAERDGVPYDVWVERGHLLTTPGKVIKLGPIAQRIAEIDGRCTIRVLAYDRYRHKELDSDLADEGVIVPMMEHPQGFRRGGRLLDASGKPILGDDGKPRENPLWMPDSVQELENAIVEERLTVKENPVLRWNVASVVIRDDPAGTGNRIMDKRKSTGRIDGAVSLAMATGASQRWRVPGDGGSVYDTEDFFI